MDEPLATCAGNSLEVMTAMDCLTMRRIDKRLFDLTISLGGSLLKSAQVVASLKEGENKIRTSLEGGFAAEKFSSMVAALGGPLNFLERYKDLLPEAATIVEVKSNLEGFVSEIDVRRLGLIVVFLGGGRMRQDDKLDLSVGLDLFLPLGSKVYLSTVLARVHGRDEASVLKAAEEVRLAYKISSKSIDKKKIIIKRISK